MSKIILEFDGVEEYQEARLAMDAMNWKMVVWDIDQKLRQTTKYGVSILHNDKLASDIEIEIAEKYREEIAKIKVPVVILAATFPDKATVEKTYQTQFEKLPSVKIFYAENAAHFVMYDQPEWFLKNLTENVN